MFEFDEFGMADRERDEIVLMALSDNEDCPGSY